MNDTISAYRFALKRIDDRTWVIRDTPAPTRAARALARITVTESDDVEVVWAAALPLPTTYISAQDALESLEAWAGPRRSTKPIPIPHFPPAPEHPRQD